MGIHSRNSFEPLWGPQGWFEYPRGCNHTIKCKCPVLVRFVEIWGQNPFSSSFHSNEFGWVLEVKNIKYVAIYELHSNVNEFTLFTFDLKRLQVVEHDNAVPAVQISSIKKWLRQDQFDKDWQSWKLNSWSFTVHTVGPLIHPNNKQWRKFTNSALCHLAFASYGAGCWSCHVSLPYNFVANHRGYDGQPTMTASHLFIDMILICRICFIIFLVYIDKLTNHSHVFFLTLHHPGWVHDFEVIVPLFVYMWNICT